MHVPKIHTYKQCYLAMWQSLWAIYYRKVDRLVRGTSGRSRNSCPSQVQAEPNPCRISPFVRSACTCDVCALSSLSKSPFFVTTIISPWIGNQSFLIVTKHVWMCLTTYRYVSLSLVSLYAAILSIQSWGDDSAVHHNNPAAKWQFKYFCSSHYTISNQRRWTHPPQGLLFHPPITINNHAVPLVPILPPRCWYSHQSH